jgi:glycosyltransferase involved in cell wall biosynthesis
MSKKKVLIISPGLPYPPVDGHKLKLYNLALQLTEKVDLHLIVISNEKVNTECEIFLNQTFSSYKIFKFSIIFYILNLLKSIFNKKIPYQVAYYTFPKVRKYLESIQKNVDYVIFNLIRTTGYSDVFEENQIILDMVDSIGINYLKSRNKTSSLLYKLIYLLDTKRLLIHEKKSIKTSKYTLLVNKTEADYYKKYGRVLWLPNGVNKELLNISHLNNRPIICFFGAMFYQPNIDAVIWFSKNVFPKLNPYIKFYIIGGRPSNEILKLSNDRIIVTDFLDNPYDLIASSICTVAPMQTGGGIQNKVLESMALGKITVTNDLGSNPIVGSCNMNNILIANTPDEFANLINELFIDPEKFSHIGANARDLIRKNYSWENYGDFLYKLLN